MQKMSLKERLLRFAKLLSLPMRALSGYWREKRWQTSRISNESDPTLEIEHRRSDTRSSIKGQVKRLWDAHYEPPAMGQLLQKYTLRTKKDAELQQEKESRRSRNSQIALVSKHPGYKHLVSLWATIEADSLYKLRHPERKNLEANGEAGLSDEFYRGKQIGRLEMIEDTRLTVMAAIQELAYDRKLEAEKAARKKENEANQGSY